VGLSEPEWPCGIAFACAGGALYVISSFFVPLPLVKTWTQRAADRYIDSRRVFRDYLLAAGRGGAALRRQRQAHIFDEHTQEEEESDWGWGVLVFLEEAVGKATASDFEEQVLTYISPPTPVIGIGKGRWDIDVAMGIAYLDDVIAKSESIPLRRFKPKKWSATRPP
jgi:hypothetical protein